MEFEILPEVRDSIREKNSYYNRRAANLRKLPTSSGIFVLFFPNGRRYLGYSKSIRQGIKKIFQGLFPSELARAARRRESKPEFQTQWYQRCREDDPNFTSYLQVKVWVYLTPDYKNEWRRHIKDLKSEEKDLYYN